MSRLHDTLLLLWSVSHANCTARFTTIHPLVPRSSPFFVCLCLVGFFFLMSNKCKHQEQKNKPRSGSGDKTETESPCQSWDRVKKKLTKSQTEKVDQRDPMMTLTGSSVLHHCELKILKSQKRRDFFWEEQSKPSARHLYRSHRNMWPSVPPTLMWTRASATADGDAIHSSRPLKCTNT